MRLHSPRPGSLRRLLAVALFFTAACDDAVSPRAPDGAGLRSDLDAVADAVNAPTSLSFGALGASMGVALGGPMLWMQGDAPSVALPGWALGKTFVYDTLSRSYVESVRAGAPVNGVRFILYTVDREAGALVLPLVESGWADFTHQVAGGVESIRVQAWANLAPPVKVLDYTASLRGPELAPSLGLVGWVRNGTDSLTFGLSTGFDLANEGLRLDWRMGLPARGITSRLRTTFSFSEQPRLIVDGLVRSNSGELGLEGAIGLESGGTLAATINGGSFAKATLSGLAGLGEFDDAAPVFTRPDGSPLSPEARALLDRMFEWFAGGFALIGGLMDPMQTLLSPVMPLQ